MLIQFTGAFVLGLLLGAFVPYLPCTVTVVLFCIAAGVTFLEFRRDLPFARGMLIYTGVLLGVMYWAAAGNRASPATSFALTGSPQQIIGQIDEPIRYSPGRMVLTLETRTSRIRVTWRDPDRIFLRGDRVEVFAKVYPPTTLRNPGGFDYAAYLRHHAIQGVASVTGPDRVTLLAPPPARSWEARWHLIDEWRERIREAAVRDLTDPALGLFLGMVIGMPGYISVAVRDSFMATGAVHILSISGSHLGLIAFLCFFVVRHTCCRLPARSLLVLSRRIIPTRLAAAITIIPVTFYTLLAGAEIATVRSFVMIMIFLLAVWLGRQQHLLTALAAAALVILIHQPDALFDISFQLSYLSVLAIALTIKWYGRRDLDASIPERGAWPRFSQWARDYLFLTAGVTLVTLPVVAYHFNQIAWLGVAGNLIAIPLAGFVLVPLGLGSAIWMLVTGGTTLPWSLVMEPLFNLLTVTLEGLSRVPGAEWHVASPTLVIICIFYGLLWLAVRPGRAHAYRVTATVGALAVIGLWGWSPRTSGSEDSVRVTFLDVGQGDASVIELPGGQTVLIDAGAAYDSLDLGRAVIGPFLWNRGIRRLDHVIATHPQRDHVGGLPWVLRKFPVGQYWDSQIPRDEPFYRRLHETVAGQGLVEMRAGAGQIILSSDGCRFRALNPPVGAWALPVETVARSGKQLNNHSVVTRLDCGSQSFLFAADVEAEALDRMNSSVDASPVRVLKVPHHGSKGSIDRDWIRRLRPEVAVISVGQRNHYGHPAQATIAAYEEEGVRVIRTDRDGAVWFTGRLSSPVLSVATARDSILRVLGLDRMLLRGEWRNLALMVKDWLGWNR